MQISRFWANPRRIVSTKFVFFPYLWKLNHAKFLSKSLFSVASIITYKSILVKSSSPCQLIEIIDKAFMFIVKNCKIYLVFVILKLCMHICMLNMTKINSFTIFTDIYFTYLATTEINSSEICQNWHPRK